MTQEEWRQEKERLADVRRRIRKRLGELGRTADDRRADVLAINRSFWSDISVNTDNEDDLIETAASITQQAQVLSIQERSLQLAQDALRRLERIVDAPYFSRIDFADEEARGEIERIYIGLASFMDPQSDEILVYDWRAPIASLFYDYPPGPATYRTPEADVSGELLLKRQYIVKNGELEDMFDTGLSIGDEMLQTMLGRSADDKMHNIVTTIQREQNQIIRDDAHKVLVVQGAAGSGKTSVALQRIAYLLYKHRLTLNADQMVLFSPNSLFSDYVSRVLPELGEANMQQTTFQEHLRFRLEHTGLALEDPYDQLEFVLVSDPSRDPDAAARLAGIAYKASTAFLQVIEAYGERLACAGLRFTGFQVGERVLLSAEAIAERFYSRPVGRSLGDRMEQLTAWVLERLDELEAEAERRWYRKLSRETTYVGAEQELKRLSRRRAHKTVAPLKERARQLGYIDVPGMYRELFANLELHAELAQAAGQTLPAPQQLAALAAHTLERLDAGALNYEDATPLVYLKGLVEGQMTVRTIRYVLVDEAQDYTPFHYAYLQKLFPRARFTLLGDWNQGIFSHATAGQGGYASIGDLLREPHAETIRLGKSYRSTREIMELAARVLPQGEPAEPFSRSGETPRLVAAADGGELVRLVAAAALSRRNDGAASVAVLCKTARETERAYVQLQALVPGLQLITAATLRYEAGVMILPVYLAKGLEFDAVLIYDASEAVYAEERERKLLYTACTRALHHLDVFYTGSLTPFLPQQ
ncbi:UvrD-helicase domain-containing protein [Paenibacillus athensensis]|uniref:UvrD-like helicase ATP-binding domain-containing protein n=1 Tax=Paenibacillus athensensis TaxID=1967502 RepID=A0A4Y8PS69_9BACL|nr:UvrD-helicase domain-containing protein [Paenibacillus athensensis]